MAITGKINAGTFIPKLWEAVVLRAYENKLIAKEICAMPVNAKIENLGDTVHFPGLADPTIHSYQNSTPDGYIPHGFNTANNVMIPSTATAGTTIVYEDLVDTDTTLVIDQADYFAFEVDDVLKAQAEVNVKGSQLERAGYGLRDKTDKYILSRPIVKQAALISASATPMPVVTGSVTVQSVAGATSALSITSANVISSIGKLSQYLEEANVPNEEKYIVIPPWLKLKLHLAGIKFSILEGTKGVKNGIEWTNDLGFDMYVSNNLVGIYNGTTATQRDGHVIVAGSKKSMAYASQITKTESNRLETKFADGVRGLHLYGGAVIRPECMALGRFVEGAETAI